MVIYYSRGRLDRIYTQLYITRGLLRKSGKGILETRALRAESSNSRMLLYGTSTSNIVPINELTVVMQLGWLVLRLGSNYKRNGIMWPKSSPLHSPKFSPQAFPRIPVNLCDENYFRWQESIPPPLSLI